MCENEYVTRTISLPQAWEVGEVKREYMRDVAPSQEV